MFKLPGLDLQCEQSIREPSSVKQSTIDATTTIKPATAQYILEKKKQVLRRFKTYLNVTEHQRYVENDEKGMRIYYIKNTNLIKKHLCANGFIIIEEMVMLTAAKCRFSSSTKLIRLLNLIVSSVNVIAAKG